MTKISDYDYFLPEELIAQFPPKVRGTSRLLVAQHGEIKDHLFSNLLDYIQPNDLLVLNNTRVLPARIFAHKSTGGAIEILVERLLSPTTFLAQTKASRSPKEGQLIVINGQPVFRLMGREDDFFVFETLDQEEVFPLLEIFGHMPLPPYIQRADNILDEERYQTVFSSEKGAVAAPTAGLHFTNELISLIEKKGANFAELTLHVGAGTFKPVREEHLDEHLMHKEWINVSKETVGKIKRAKDSGGRIIAIGTTVARALETAALSGAIEPFSGDTQIFIKPGFKFVVVDALVTNFHLPKSTLLVLVSTFMGHERIKHIYQHAVEQKYKFFSYGDAMLLIP